MEDQTQSSNKQLTQIPPEKQRQLTQAGFGFLPKSFEELWNYAKEIAQTDFVPNVMRGKTGAVLAAWQTGQDLGLPPMASLSGIAIINGRPSVHSDAYWALVVNHPMCEWFKETPPDEALSQGFGECTIKRRGNPHVITRKFYMHEAEKAGLTIKDNWKNYPGDMLQNRARHRCGSDAIPEATQGILPSDVARDLPADIEVTAEPERAIALPKPKETKADEKTDTAGQRDNQDRGPEREAGQATRGQPNERPPVEGDRSGDNLGKIRKGGAPEKKTEPVKDPLSKSPVADPLSGSGGPTVAGVPPWENEALTDKQRIELWIAGAPLSELDGMVFLKAHYKGVPQKEIGALLANYDERMRVLRRAELERQPVREPGEDV